MQGSMIFFDFFVTPGLRVAHKGGVFHYTLNLIDIDVFLLLDSHIFAQIHVKL